MTVPPQPPQPPSDPYQNNYNPTPYQSGYNPNPHYQSQTGSNNETNTPALIALILGILAFAGCGFLAGIPAIIVGIIGKRKAEELGGEGEGKAKAGMILGIVNLVLTVIVVGAFILLTVFAESSESSRSTSDGTRPVPMREISVSEGSVESISEGSMQYSFSITNVSESEAMYEIGLLCEGDGIEKTRTITTPEINVNQTHGISESFDFSEVSIGTYVECQVTKVNYIL